MDGNIQVLKNLWLQIFLDITVHFLLFLTSFLPEQKISNTLLQTIFLYLPQNVNLIPIPPYLKLHHSELTSTAFSHRISFGTRYTSYTCIQLYIPAQLPPPQKKRTKKKTKKPLQKQWDTKGVLSIILL